MRALLKVLFSCWTALLVFGCTKNEQPVRANHAATGPAVTLEKSTGFAHSGDVYLQFNPARSNTAVQTRSSR